MVGPSSSQAGARARLLNAYGWHMLLLSMAACALALFALPRAVAPIELPALTLDRAQVQRVLRADARDAAAAPHGARAKEFMRVWLDFGASEFLALANPSIATQRTQVLRRLHDSVATADGAAAALKLRAWALAQFEAALDDRLPGDQTKGVMGVFANALTYHQATRDGEEVAPHFVVRTLYKARWNRMLGFAPDYAFAQIEKQAYHGWIGLHAEKLPLWLRRKALQKYAAASGQNATEALGVLAFLERDYARAALLLEHAYEASPSLRLRNYAQAARAAAQASGQTAPASASAASTASNLSPTQAR